jgi:hypothetical protein
MGLLGYFISNRGIFFFVVAFSTVPTVISLRFMPETGRRVELKIRSEEALANPRKRSNLD